MHSTECPTLLGLQVLHPFLLCDVISDYSCNYLYSLDILNFSVSVTLQALSHFCLCISYILAIGHFSSGLCLSFSVKIKSPERPSPRNIHLISSYIILFYFLQKLVTSWFLFLVHLHPPFECFMRVETWSVSFIALFLVSRVIFETKYMHNEYLLNNEYKFLSFGSNSLILTLGQIASCW